MSTSLFHRSTRPLGFLLAGMLLFSCSKDDAGEETPLGPVITVSETQGISLTAEAGSAEIHYTVDNAAESGSVTAECPEPWIQIGETQNEGVVRFDYAMNTTGASRTATISLYYPGAETLSVPVTQLSSDKWLFDVEVVAQEAFSALIKISSTEQEMTYVMLNLSKADFERFSSDSELTAYYIDLFRSVAESSGITLEALIGQLLYKGDTVGEIKNLTPETDYVAVVFGLNTDATVTSDVFSCAYTTPAPPYYEQGVSFDVKTLKPNYMETQLIPGSEEYRYYGDIMKKSDFDAFTSQEEFADTIIDELEEVIRINNAFGTPTTWDDVTLAGTGVMSFNTLYSQTSYTNYAFGVSNGYRTTDVTTKEVTTPAPSLTNDCTFRFETVSSDPSLLKVRIIPSNDNAYFAMISLSSDANSMSREAYADEYIIYANSYDSWTTWKGEQVLEATDLSVDTDYTIVVFGVGEYFERNTEVNYYEVSTNRLDKVDITFDLTVTATDESSVSYLCKPSDPDQTWAVGAVRKEKYETFASDEEFAAYLQTAGNGFPILKNGEAEGNLMYDCEWATLTPGDYLLYAVACYSDGWTCEVLSDFTFTPFTIKERVFSEADVALSLKVYDGDDLVAADPVKYPAATYSGRAAVDIVATPSAACAEYYVATQSRPASVMEGMDVATLIYVAKAYGVRVEGNEPSAFGVVVSWNANNVCALAFGIDSNGVEGRPEVISLTVSPDQAVPFEPASAMPSAIRLSAVLSPLPLRSVPEMTRQAGINLPAVSTGGRLPLVGSEALEKARSVRKSEIVENCVRTRIERAGGKYYAPEERRSTSEFMRISAFERH